MSACCGHRLSGTAFATGGDDAGAAADNGGGELEPELMLARMPQMLQGASASTRGEAAMASSQPDSSVSVREDAESARTAHPNSNNKTRGSISAGGLCKVAA